MNYNQVLAILSDLPFNFTRPGNIFQSILQSWVAGSARNTIAIDALLGQLLLLPQLPQQYQPPQQKNFLALLPSLIQASNQPLANWGWLDAQGRLYGIARNPYETDSAYRIRIAGTLIAPHVTPLAMENFIQFVLGVQISIIEDLPTASYRIEFNTPVSQTTLDNIISALVWVRPAGIPFLPFSELQGGLVLNTLNYFGTKRVNGSYLVTTVNESVTSIPDATPAPQALLPTVYLTDPFLTGVVTPQNPFVPVTANTTNLSTVS